MSVSNFYEKYQKKYKMRDTEPIPFILNSGSRFLNSAIGVGGYPAGRIIEIFGPESTGKSTLVYHALAEGQKAGHKVALIDPECSFDAKYAKMIGFQGEENIDYIHLLPEWGEQAIDQIIDLVDDGFKIIAVDSVAAMVPHAELVGDTGEAHMGLHARMMSQAMRKLTNRVYASGVVLIFINQTRSKIGVFFGSPETTTGGNALKFYASIRLRLSNGETIGSNESQIGKYMKIEVVKNKVYPPFKKTVIPVIFGKGISKEYELFDYALVQGRITQRSSYYYIGEEKIGNGKVDAINNFSKDFDKWEKIITEVK